MSILFVCPQKAHLALIDALMRAYLCEVASVEKVAKAVRYFGHFAGSYDNKLIYSIAPRAGF